MLTLNIILFHLFILSCPFSPRKKRTFRKQKATLVAFNVMSAMFKATLFIVFDIFVYFIFGLLLVQHQFLYIVECELYTWFKRRVIVSVHVYKLCLLFRVHLIAKSVLSARIPMR